MNYFDKNPNDALGYNVCKKCSKKFKITTSVSILRTHLKTHQLKAPTKKQAVVIKKKILLTKKNKTNMMNILFNG